MSAVQLVGCALPHLLMSSAAVPPVGDAGMGAFPKKPRWPPSDVSDLTGDAAKTLPERLDESPPEDCRQHEEQCREQPAGNGSWQASTCHPCLPCMLGQMHLDRQRAAKI